MLYTWVYDLHKNKKYFLNLKINNNFLIFFLNFKKYIIKYLHIYHSDDIYNSCITLYHS